MNSGFLPIPATMPVDRAADLMVRRGEARNFFQARARILRQRQRSGHDYGRTAIAPADRAAFAAVETPRQVRLPYKDE